MNELTQQLLVVINKYIEGNSVSIEDGWYIRDLLEQIDYHGKVDTTNLQEKVYCKNFCLDCGYEWSEHDFGVPKPICP